MDVWQNAKANAQPGCLRCDGSGTYLYDHSHGTVCDLCCRHDMGWWQLTEHHPHPGKWCCRAGCGVVRDDNPDALA